MSADGRIASAAIALGGLTDSPVRLAGLESSLVGKGAQDLTQGLAIQEQLAAAAQTCRRPGNGCCTWPRERSARR